MTSLKMKVFGLINCTLIPKYTIVGLAKFADQTQRNLLCKMCSKKYWTLVLTIYCVFC